MNTAIQNTSVTFPHGFLDFLHISQKRRHRIGEYELEPARLARFNKALHDISPEAPSMTMDQIAAAAERAMARHGNGDTPPFVESRMAALARLEVLAADPAWSTSNELRRQVDVLRDYQRGDDSLIPNDQPVIGLLDDAVLVDVALQLLRDDLADYEDFCRFRRVAAEFSGVPEADTGLTREHWLEALIQAHSSLAKVDAPRKREYVPDPRASLFHIT